ncbi:MAG TPA: cytochrome c oxidase assembly factor Coa1 family protein, partial [Herpetosiphonaceae bacterium]
DSVDDMPPDMRRAYQRLMGVFADENGDGMPDIFEVADPYRKYNSADQLPPEARKVYEQAMGAFAQQDAFGRDGFKDGAFSFTNASTSSVNVVVTQGARRKKPGGPLNWIIGLALMALFAAGGIGLFSWLLRSSESYDIAFARARASAQVREVFGEPLTAGWWTSGRISSGGSTTSVRYALPVSGPLQDGRMQISGFQMSGEWDLTVTLTYERDGATQTIRLDE